MPDVSTSRGACAERRDDCQNAGPGKYASSPTDGLNTMCGTRPSAHWARNSDRSSCCARGSSYHDRPDRDERRVPVPLVRVEGPRRQRRGPQPVRVEHRARARGEPVEGAVRRRHRQDARPAMAWRAMRSSAEAPAFRSSGPPRARRCATRPVQPVWCEAPIPAPVSPWKYSWNSNRSRHSGSSRNFAMRPATGRWPSASGSQIETSRADRSAATSRRRSRRPDPVGYSTVNGLAQRLVPAQHRLDEQVVHREPHRAAPVRVAAEQVRSSTRRARSRSTPGSPRSRSGTAGRGAGATAPGARAARGTRRPRRAPRAARARAARAAGG